MYRERVRLSVVAPAYNERAVLPLFHAELSAVLDRLAGDYEAEVVYVDDGSTDGTLELLRRLAATDGRVRFVSLSRNFGHQAAFTAGLARAAGDVVVLLDCDLQHPPALIPTLLARWRDGADVVITRRQARGQGVLRRLTGWVFARLTGAAGGQDISDYFLLSRRAVDALARLPESHRFLRGLVRWLGFASAEVEFVPGRRRAGTSKFTPRRLAGYALDALLSFSRVPVRLVAGLGLVFVLTALAGAAAGWDGLLVSLYLVGGAVLGGLGVVGGYVVRVFEQVKGRPLYLVKETEADAIRRGEVGDAARRFADAA